MVRCKWWAFPDLNWGPADYEIFLNHTSGIDKALADEGLFNLRNRRGNLMTPTNFLLYTPINNFHHHLLR